MYNPKLRDSQRSKVYEAENILWNKGKRFKTIEQVEAYITHIFNTPWFRSRFPLKQFFIVEHSKSSVQASGSSYGKLGVIMSLPEWAWRESVILHELAHGLQKANKPAHGPDFCQVYLALVTRFMGNAMGITLLEKFLSNKVVITRA